VIVPVAVIWMLAASVFGGTERSARSEQKEQEGGLGQARQLSSGAIQFDHASGFYTFPFKVSLLTGSSPAGVYYTTNGMMPGRGSGLRYRGSILISGTTILRVAGFEKGKAEPVELGTATYIFKEDLVRQKAPQLPANWGIFQGQPLSVHYTVAASIANDPAYHQAFLEGLTSIPSMSIITEPENLFGSETGIYTHPMERGVGWERPVSVELMYPDGRAGFRIDCGLRIHGGMSRRPEESPKHSFRLVFGKKYGPGELRFPLFGSKGAQEFDSLILRAGYNNSWVHTDSRERRRADYIRDQWMRDSMQAMGYPSARGIFVHLYLNGLYWGVYNLCERPSAAFVAANEGGSPTDYESRKAGKQPSGDETAWRKMMALANSGLGTAETYRGFQQYLDVPELVDYLILNYYAGNSDWDRSSNWYAARRAAGGKFQFFVWDAERTLEGVDANTLDFDDDESPPRLFHKLAENAEFRVLFGDRVRRLLFNGGPLTSERAAERYEKLVQAIEKSMVAESARWGSYRRDVHPYRTGPYELYTRDDHWRPETQRIITEYFPRRAEVVLKQFRELGVVR